MLVVVAVVVIFLAFYQGVSDEISVKGYQTKFFRLSEGASLNMFNQMKRDGLSEDSLLEFVTMEDRFLGLEKMSVCTSISRITEATALSNVIKERFAAYTFPYHTIHLKQIGEPLKMINRHISC